MLTLRIRQDHDRKEWLFPLLLSFRRNEDVCAPFRRCIISFLTPDGMRGYARFLPLLLPQALTILKGPPRF
jgi:hypothetical protein